MRFVYRAHDGVQRQAWLLLPASYDGGPDPARHLATRPRRRRRGQRPVLGRPARGGRVRGRQSRRRGSALAPVLVGRPGPDRRPRAHAGDRPTRSACTSTAAASTPSAARWADRRRCSSSHGTRACSRAQPRSTRQPTWRGATATSPPPERPRAAAARAGRARWHTRRRCPPPTAVRSPDAYLDAIAFSGVPLQIYWSTRDRVIARSGRRGCAARGRAQSDQPGARAVGLRRRLGSHGRDAVDAGGSRGRSCASACCRRADVPPLPAGGFRRAPATAV